MLTINRDKIIDHGSLKYVSRILEASVFLRSSGHFPDGNLMSNLLVRIIKAMVYLAD